MKRLVTLAACAALAVIGAGLVRAQSDAPYTEGPVWAITMVKTKPGMGDDYLKTLAKIYKSTNDEMKKQGLIMDYKVLLGAIDEVHALPVKTCYVKTIPIVQSSGMGKSRTVDRIAMERILFPLCLRDYLGNNYFGTQQSYIFRDKINNLCSSISSHRLAGLGISSPYTSC